MRATVVSLFDSSGIVLKPWALQGADCYCFDIKNETKFEDGIQYVKADLNPGSLGWIDVERVLQSSMGIRIGFSFPPCNDLASSGSRHFAKKRKKDPLFQRTAVSRAVISQKRFSKNGFAFCIENPVGMLSSLWMPPMLYWHPYEFGGYLPDDDVHPLYPEYIPPRDAYTKKTGAWFGGGFVFPEKRAVDPEVLQRTTKNGRLIRGSRQFMLLGGSSDRTKTIRSLTPRGISEAFYQANRG